MLVTVTVVAVMVVVVGGSSDRTDGYDTNRVSDRSLAFWVMVAKVRTCSSHETTHEHLTSTRAGLLLDDNDRRLLDNDHLWLLHDDLLLLLLLLCHDDRRSGRLRGHCDNEEDLINWRGVLATALRTLGVVRGGLLGVRGGLLHVRGLGRRGVHGRRLVGRVRRVGGHGPRRVLRRDLDLLLLLDDDDVLLLLE